MIRLLLLLSIGLCTVPAMAANIVNIVGKKGIVVIDEGSSSGVTKGSKVCFFQGDKQKACGKVRKVNKDKSFVKVAKIKLIKKDMTAEVDGGGGSGSATLDLKGFWAITLSAPSTFNKISFDTASTEDASGASSAWTNSGSIDGVSMFGGGAEVAIPMMGMKVGLGLKFRKRGFEGTANYDNADVSQFVALDITEDAMGVIINTYFAQVTMGPTYLEFGAGLDVDMAKVTTKITQKSDNSSDETNIFTGTSSLTAISLAVSADLWIPAGPIGFFIGPHLLLPLSGASSGFAGDPITDAQVLGAITDGTDPNEDLNTALGHKRNSFSIMILAGGAVML